MPEINTDPLTTDTIAQVDTLGEQVEELRNSVENR